MWSFRQEVETAGVGTGVIVILCLHPWTLERFRMILLPDWIAGHPCMFPDCACMWLVIPSVTRSHKRKGFEGGQSVQYKHAKFQVFM